MDFSLFQKSFFILLFASFFANAQYTDVINSNRPGKAVSAYAVGTNVIQAEVGLVYEQRDHATLDYDSNIFGADVSLRYGLHLETLELNWEGTFMSQGITYTNLGTEETLTDFSRNRLGLKFLVFDPFKNPENNKPNLYSWRANHVFQWKNLIPAVSVYAGATFNLGDNPFYLGDPIVAPRAAVATQSRLSPRLVFITNFAYDRIGTDFPEMSYAVSLTHSFRDPKWSIFVENQGIKSDRYSDTLLRTGVAYLFGPNFQADFHLGSGFRNTPSRIFAVLGFSYRLDLHKDKLVAIEDQKPQSGKIKKNAVKKKKKESKKKNKKQENELDF